MKKTEDFVISSPTWNLVLMCVAAALGGAAVIAGSILLALQLFGAGGWWMIGIGSFFGLLGSLGIYTYFADRVSFIDGVYRVGKPFQKAGVAAAADVKEVELKEGRGMAMTVVFWGKDGTELFHFSDNGATFRNKVVQRSLQKNGIRLIVNSECVQLSKKKRK